MLHGQKKLTLSVKIVYKNDDEERFKRNRKLLQEILSIWDWSNVAKEDILQQCDISENDYYKVVTKIQKRAIII